MIPERWMILERMPHNGNGKADRKLLKEMFLLETGATPQETTAQQETTLRTAFTHAR
jgi:hypothetical protein